MARTQSEETRRAAFGTAAQQMHERVCAWCRAHPDASFDEIAEVASQERKQLMGDLLGEVAAQEGAMVVDRCCPDCGNRLQNKGQKIREVLHREGVVRLARTYSYCPACQHGFFPPGPASGAGSSQLESGDDPHGAAAGGGDSLV